MINDKDIQYKIVTKTQYFSSTLKCPPEKLFLADFGGQIMLEPVNRKLFQRIGSVIEKLLYLDSVVPEMKLAVSPGKTKVVMPTQRKD